MNATKPVLTTHTCSRCFGTIPALVEHVRMTIQMTVGEKDTRRYCIKCCQDPELAVLLSDVCNNPVKRIEVFMVYR